ncbi:S41 family peptidase [Halofilum ochraceum]|uniref:S41 family peptidase n=1 Tax=Halofilum ochraceum TaxID=1611323 RepID=UPI0008D9755E|nr:S41 family peptidase [Halofilum ochraceum]
MAHPTRKLLLVLLGTVLGATLTLGHAVLAQDEDRSAAEELPLEQLRTFTDVYSRIKDNYVEEIDDDQLLEYAIEGMLNGLDPHSSYLNQEAFRELQIGTQGEFGGLGIEVTMEDGFVRVVAPIDGTPAARAGIQAGDLIVRLDDKPVKGMTLNDAVQKMRGEPGTDIELMIVRDGEDKPIRVTITRDTIEVTSVDSRMLEPGYGYLRVSHFQTNTQQAVDEAIRGLKDKAENGLRGLVLDLRNNPGGVLSAAVSVSDTFLEDGLIVYTEGRVKDSKLRYSARPGDAIDGAPMIVLVNEGSASASEIVAGALQDHERALVVGKQTFGKGSVQTIQDLSNGGALKLTTARYYTPDGRSIQAEGIEPDIATGAYRLTSIKDEGVGALTEADLAQHLTNPNGEDKDDAAKDEDADSGDGENGDLATSDYELYVGLNVLKALSIFGSK